MKKIFTLLALTIAFTVSAQFNTNFGTESLNSNTIGFSNSAFGYQSLKFNTTGSDNTASGYKALYTNTEGSNNTAYGQQSLVYQHHRKLQYRIWGVFFKCQQHRK